MAPGELRKLQKGWQGVDSQFYVMVFWLAVSSMLMFKHISNDDPQGASIFWRWGGTSGWLLLGTITQSCTGMISMHPGAAAESPRANDKAFSCCRIFLGWLSVMCDDCKWHVASGMLFQPSYSSPLLKTWRPVVFYRWIYRKLLKSNHSVTLIIS